MGASGMFPDFKLEHWLTEKGAQRARLNQELGACFYGSGIVTGPDLVRPDFAEIDSLNEWINATSVVGKPIYGPMLVITGNADSAISVDSISAAVDATCAAVTTTQIEFHELEGVGHNPAMSVGQSLGMDWIIDRFKGKPDAKGRSKTKINPLWDNDNYEQNGNWLLLWAS